MKLTVLGSGSRGNAVLVESDRTRLLIDAGFTARELERRLLAVDVPPGALTALWITHEHRDHTIGMGVFARRYGLPIYLTEGTRNACADLLNGCGRLRLYRPAHAVTIGALRVEPFLTAHDAADPVSVTVTEPATGHRVGLATDVGAPTAGVRHALRGCHVLVLEANHDEILLREGPYPKSVVSRIAGRHGHLSNRAAARLAADLHHDDLTAVVLAHLSRECNRPELARTAVADALARVRYRGALLLAGQDEPLGPIDVGDGLRRLAPPQLSLW
jgi:phosphoribosyl 1,2-cyclic phosphodiesterase